MAQQPATSSRRTIPVGDAYVHCEQLTRLAARNFYYPIAGLPREQKRAMCAVYAFSRGADDIADEPGIPDRGARFAEYRRLLASAYEGEPGNEVFTALADAVKRFHVPRSVLEEIVDGAEQDLTVTRYATFADLSAYCHKVASAVGLACIEIFGYSDPAARGYAETLGIGMQLTNILRDVGEDAGRGRFYLPADELARFGVTEEDLVAGRVTGPFRALMQFQTARARDYFRRSDALFPLLTRKARFCPLAIRGMYRGILVRIERRGYDVFSRRISLSTPAKVACVVGAWFRAWTV